MNTPFGLYQRARRSGARSVNGFTLIELMVAMLLGLIVMAGVSSVFISNQQVYRSNKGLSDVQDSTRMAFEMLSRDIRTAGLTGCGNSGRVANVLNGTHWWANWNNAVQGFTAAQSDPAAGTSRIAATESVMLIGAEGSGISVLSNTEPAGTFTINESSSGLQSGDVVVVCDPDHGAIVQLTSATASTLTHATTGTPGNCSKDLSYPTVCSSTSSYVFAPNAQIAKLTAADWYVGNNGVNGTSLYRLSVATSAGAVTTPPVEMVRGVTSLQLGYHQAGNTSFLSADQINDWLHVDAVRATLTVVSADTGGGPNAKPISRTFTSTTTLRNRVP